MRNRVLAWALALASVAVTAVPRAAEARSSSKTLHVEVDESGGDRVSIAVPVGLAKAALAIAGKVEIEVESGDVSVDELRSVWKELRASGEARVDIRSDGDTVKIRNERGFVTVDVQEDAGDTVKIQVPEQAIDALLSGKTGLDVGAALSVLEKTHTGELIRVEDGRDSLRIWIE